MIPPSSPLLRAMQAVLGSHKRIELARRLKEIPKGSKVIDVGSLGFGLKALCDHLGRTDINHTALDYMPPEGTVPAGLRFLQADLNKGGIPCADGEFDFVFASHLIEHIKDPLQLFSECVRILKPGGYIYIEAPSERAALLPGMPFMFERFKSLSFYDDPTHCSRPWSPQSLYRLAKYYQCEPVRSGYYISWRRRLLSPLLIPACFIFRQADLLENTLWLVIGWASYLVARKPAGLKGAAEFKYSYA
jgi:SAM-dependent methyltransferase